MHKLSDILNRAKKALAPIGASHEVRWMAGRAFLLEEAELLTRPDRQIPPEQAAEFARMVAERMAGRPLQYILGEWWFFGLPVKVKEGVLIPRFDTEIAAGRAIDWIDQNDVQTALDLCCGSGCIALAIAAHTQAAVTAADICPAAVELTRENAERNGFAHRIDVVESDLFANLPGRFGLIASNPPYIPDGDIAGLDEEVRAHEPLLALRGGQDGLDFYRKIAKQSPAHLKNRGKLVLEVGVRQAQAVAGLLGQNGFEQIAIHKDLSGVERVVEGITRDGEN